MMGVMEPLDVITVDTQTGYDRWSAIYDDEENPLILLEEPRVRALVGDVRGQRVADVGCGTGRHSVWLADAGAVVTGYDFSEPMLARAKAKRRAERVQLVSHDVTQPIPAGDEAFDQVVSCLVLDHIPELVAYFDELARICRRGGAITLSTVHPAMMLKGVRARFTDPQTQQRIMPASCAHQISDYVMAVTRTTLRLVHLSEHVMDEQTARHSERAQKYVGWPLLLLMQLRK